MLAHRRTVVCLLLIAVALGADACRRGPATPARQAAAALKPVAWRPVGSWSGQGDIQTESFTGDTGSLRVRWQTTHEDQPGAGAFQLTLHSAISGRPLVQAVDHQGVGGATTYVAEDPRVFFFVVESAHLEWSFTVDEGMAATTLGASVR